MEGLDVVGEEMMAAARAASERAYAPYSEFRVGAAVLTESGEVFTGCNVENASYSLTICAERNAIFQAIAAGHRRISAIVVYVPSGDPAPPCGACRQVMAEFASGAEVLCFSGNGASLRTTADELLPFPFRLES